MLGLIAPTGRIDNLPYSVTPGELTERGRAWTIELAGELYRVDLPIWEDGRLDYHSSSYALAHVAKPNMKRMLAACDQQAAEQLRQEGRSELEIIAQLGPDPSVWQPEDYIWHSGSEIATEAVIAAFKRAFETGGGLAPQPCWLEERLLALIRVETAFQRVDFNRPLECDLAEVTVRMLDRELIEAWMSRHQVDTFMRSEAFLGRIDFLATQGEDANFKGYLLPGVTISDGQLVGGAAQTTIDLTWRVPFGAAREPVRAIVARGNMVEALPLVNPERPLVDWHPDAQGIDYVDGTPTDGNPSYTLAPGINLVTALVSWPGWLYKDAILVRRSAAERAQHWVPQGQTFFTGPDWRFIDGDDDGAIPSARSVAAGAVLCVDGDQTITAPRELLPNAQIDPSGYRRLTCPDPLNQSNRVRHYIQYRSAVPLVTGCKLTTRYGYKALIRVVDDRLMPDGIDVLAAQENIPSRGIALPTLAEMALSKIAVVEAAICHAGRNVTREQVLDMAGPFVEPETIDFIARMVRFEDEDGSVMEGRLVMNIQSRSGRTLYHVQLADGTARSVWDDAFLAYPDGSSERVETGTMVQATVGPIYWLIQDRHPRKVAGMCRRPSRDERGLTRRGNGAVVIGLNEVQTLISRGQTELADLLRKPDPAGVDYAHELIDALAGPLAGTAGELPAIPSGGPTHWRYELLDWRVTPEARQHSDNYRSELIDVMANASYLDPGCGWQLVNKEADGCGNLKLALERRDADRTVCRAILLRCLHLPTHRAPAAPCPAG